MPSEHGAYFNHDPQALRYDNNVRDEGNPIRDGYAATLAWTSAMVKAQPGDLVVDLGSGTGNTALGLDPDVRILGVDLSEKMTALARSKLADREHVAFVIADLLDWMLDPQGPSFDGLVSTYAVHHLTAEEKVRLFEGLWQRLRPGGRAAFGDLMFASAKDQEAVVAELVAAGHDWMPEEVEDEFFWHVDRAVAALERIGFELLETRRFSDLSWGIAVRRPTD
jgi:putative AdoMet-dependent methyltransferase